MLSKYISSKNKCKFRKSPLKVRVEGGNSALRAAGERRELLELLCGNLVINTVFCVSGASLGLPRHVQE